MPFTFTPELVSAAVPVPLDEEATAEAALGLVTPEEALEVAIPSPRAAEPAENVEAPDTDEPESPERPLLARRLTAVLVLVTAEPNWPATPWVVAEEIGAVRATIRPSAAVQMTSGLQRAATFTRYRRVSRSTTR